MPALLGCGGHCGRAKPDSCSASQAQPLFGGARRRCTTIAGLRVGATWCSLFQRGLGTTIKRHRCRGSIRHMAVVLLLCCGRANSHHCHITIAGEAALGCDRSHAFRRHHNWLCGSCRSATGQAPELGFGEVQSPPQRVCLCLRARRGCNRRLRALISRRDGRTHGFATCGGSSHRMYGGFFVLPVAHNMGVAQCQPMASETTQVHPLELYLDTRTRRRGLLRWRSTLAQPWWRARPRLQEAQFVTCPHQPGLRPRLAVTRATPASWRQQRPTAASPWLWRQRGAGRPQRPLPTWSPPGAPTRPAAQTAAYTLIHVRSTGLATPGVVVKGRWNM